MLHFTLNALMGQHWVVGVFRTQYPASLMAQLQGQFNHQSSMDELCNQISAGQTDQLIAALLTIRTSPCQEIPFCKAIIYL